MGSPVLGGPRRLYGKRASGPAGMGHRARVMDSNVGSLRWEA